MRERTPERKLTLTPHNERIDSCTACGRENYKGGGFDDDSPPIEPNGVQLYLLNANGWCTKFCPECLRELVGMIKSSSAWVSA